ncbi:MAG: hypothetical protein AAGG48_31245 [Planctomycetota bacterium]
MRFRRRVVNRYSFGVTSLFALVAISIFIMWWGAFVVVFAAGSIAAHYGLLSIGSSLITHLGATPNPPRFRKWQCMAPDDGEVLRVTVMTFLLFYYLYNFYWLMVLRPAGYSMFWHAPSIGPLTLAHVVHLCFAGFALLLVTFFWFRAYSGGSFSRRMCFETSTLLTFLLASHLAIP